MKRKGWMLSVLSVVGALTFTVIVFAGGDTAEHNKSREHRHRTSARSTEPYKDWVQWSVEVGRMYWDNTSTFVWHDIVVRNNSDKALTGDWEFNHHVIKEDRTWADDDTTFGPVSLSGGETWSKSGCSEVYFPSGSRKEGLYQITAYTRISLYYKGKEVTKPSSGQRKNQRDIKSVWFDVF